MRSILSNKRATTEQYNFPFGWEANMVKEGRENERKGGRFVNVTKKSYQMKMQSCRGKDFICQRKRASILQGLGLTSLCPTFAKMLAISICNLHLHTSSLLIMDINPIKSSLQKTTPTASLTVNMNAPSAPL